MSRIDSLPPDLKAVLSLLLRQRKRHAEVAGLLGIQERAVHDRAHAALALLAPSQARALTALQRERLGEYLLGQQAPAAEDETRSFLESSAAARAWSQALASELTPLAGRSLPRIPAPRPVATRREPPETAETPSEPSSPTPTTRPSAAEPQMSSSRVGGAVILGALAAVVIVVVLLVVGIGGGGGGGSHTGTQPSASSTNAARSHTSSGAGKGAGAKAGTGGGTGATTTGTSASSSPTSHGKALTLTPPNPGASKAVGVAYVLTQKNQRAFYLFAKGLPALPSGAFYAVWLDGASSAPAYPLGSLPSASASGLVEGGGPLPTSAGSYRRLIVTTETSHHPSRPGPTALGGAFSLS
jgi:hypothetical protein